MDAEGARALARRIEEQRLRDEAASVRSSPKPLASPASPTVTFSPIEIPAVAPRAAARAARSALEIARMEPRAPLNERDIRRYTRTVRPENVGGRPALVTTVRCQALVDDEWQTRVVAVHIEDRETSG